jgi:hypothetical protein
MLLCGIVDSGASPASGLVIGTVWHPPPGRLRPLLCILTV